MSTPAGDQAVDLLVVGVDQLVEGDVASRGSATLAATEADLSVGPMLPATNRGRSGVLSVVLVADAPGERGGGPVHLEGTCLPGRYLTIVILFELNVLVSMMSAPASR